jgi:hypothetical protein
MSKRTDLEILTNIHALRPSEYEKVVLVMPSVYMYTRVASMV